MLASSTEVSTSASPTARRLPALRQPCHRAPLVAAGRQATTRCQPHPLPTLAIDQLFGISKAGGVESHPTPALALVRLGRAPRTSASSSTPPTSSSVSSRRFVAGLGDDLSVVVAGVNTAVLWSSSPTMHRAQTSTDLDQEGQPL